MTARRRIGLWLLTAGGAACGAVVALMLMTGWPASRAHRHPVDSATARTAAGPPSEASSAGAPTALPTAATAGTSTGAHSLARRLERDVKVLAGRFPRRNHRNPSQLNGAAEYIARRLTSAALKPHRETYVFEGAGYANVVAEVPGASRPDEIVVIGAHYDAVPGSPGADDNASGVAAMLALAELLGSRPHARTLRLVAFVNEEPPFFHNGMMGSEVHARRSRERGEDIVAMLSLETLGYYTDAADTQLYPPPLSALYPSRGNFIAFVGNLGSMSLTRRAVAAFREHSDSPAESAWLPGWIDGVGWSDHRSFWRSGYKGVMVTDTAPFRNPHYHEATDTPDKLDFERLAEVVSGLRGVVADLCGSTWAP